MASDLSRWLGVKDLVTGAVRETTRIVERSQRSFIEKPLEVLRSIPSLEETAQVLDAAWELYATATFRTIRGVSWAAGGLAGGGISLLSWASPQAEPEPATPIRSDVMWSRPWCRDMALSVVNGLVGDLLRDAGNPLHTAMSLRHDGALLPLEPDALRAALPDASGKLCVFVHGACTTEWSWALGAEAIQGDPRVTYGSLLAEELGFTPLYLRYSSGLHISENGEELSTLLDALLAAYPRPVEELVLIGHSMGGLVARSACHQAAAAKRPWLEHTSRLICLAAPHEGAPLEKLGNVATSLLEAVGLPSTQIPAELANARSAGIKDLRFGFLLHEDWRGHDPDAPLEDTRRPPTPLEGIETHFLASCFTNDPAHPAGRLFGDFMVRVPSASGGAAARDADAVLGGLSHYDVLNHPRVYAQIKTWCAV